jgi:hypothetical protein
VSGAAAAPLQSIALSRASAAERSWAAREVLERLRDLGRFAHATGDDATMVPASGILDALLVAIDANDIKWLSARARQGRRYLEQTAAKVGDKVATLQTQHDEVRYLRRMAINGLEIGTHSSDRTLEWIANITERCLFTGLAARGHRIWLHIPAEEPKWLRELRPETRARARQAILRVLTRDARREDFRETSAANLVVRGFLDAIGVSSKDAGNMLRAFEDEPTGLADEQSNR